MSVISLEFPQSYCFSFAYSTVFDLLPSLEVFSVLQKLLTIIPNISENALATL